MLRPTFNQTTCSLTAPIDGFSYALRVELAFMPESTVLRETVPPPLPGGGPQFSRRRVVSVAHPLVSRLSLSEQEVAVALLFIAIALLASLVPAWRSTSVDPLMALRAD